MSGIICWPCSISAISALCNGKTSSTRIRRRTCHSQIATHDEFDREDAFGRVFFNFIKTGRTSYGYQDPVKSVASDDRSGKPVQPSQPDYTQEDMVDLGLLKSGKVELRSTIDRGNLRKFLGIHWRKLTLIVENIFSAGRRILQGTKRLFTIERGNRVSASPRTGLFRKFRHGQWRSRICEQSQRPSAKKTEKNVERCRVRWWTFNNMGNVHGCDDESGDIHGREFLNYSKCCQESWKSHFETDVRCHNAVGEQSGRNQLPGQNSVVKEFLDTSVINWRRT